MVYRRGFPSRPWHRVGASIGRITTAGVITEFPLTPGTVPYLIAAGPDGNLWFTEASGNKIGRITPTGVITEFSTPTILTSPDGITTGPDGNLWFTEGAGNIGRINIGPLCGTTYSGTFNGNLTISSGQVCITNGTVTGNVTQSGGGLFTGNATIRGNLQITGGGTFSIGPAPRLMAICRFKTFRRVRLKTRFAAQPWMAIYSFTTMGPLSKSA